MAGPEWPPMVLPHQFIPLHPTLWSPCYKARKGRVKGKNGVRKRKKRGLAGKQPVVGSGGPQYLRWGWWRLAPRDPPCHPPPASGPGNGQRGRRAPRRGGLGVPDVEGPEESPEAGAALGQLGQLRADGRVAEAREQLTVVVLTAP